MLCLKGTDVHILYLSKTMRDKKLQVFVSSTYTDLKEERQAAVEAILSSGNIPAGMELFSAGDESQMAVIERWIDESDVYLLILGGRYGSIEPKSGKSYTHLEYEYAVSKNKPLFAVVISDKGLDEKAKEGRHVLEQEYGRELKSFRSSVTNHLVKFWEDKKDIKLAIYDTLMDFNHTKSNLVGWVRGDRAVNTGFLAEEMARLTSENGELRKQLQTESNGNVALYGGLKYEEMESLLKKDNVTFNEKSMNVFDFFIKKGEGFISGLAPQDVLEQMMFERFLLYSVIIRYMTSRYRFTEHGHNFYLKALVKKNSGYHI